MPGAKSERQTEKAEDGQPRIRPFGGICIFDDKLYFVTNNQKKVYQQMKNNEKVEICGMYEGTWIRISGNVKEDVRREARVAMMDEYTEALSKIHMQDKRNRR